MPVSVVRRYSSRLPPSDFHPYRTGAWTPNTVEVDATDLEVVEGEIPRDLHGTYLRNTENPLFEAITGRYHPFDGDGMVHAIHFGNGRADYRNRFVRTSGLLAELEAGQALWAGILESPEASLRDGCGARTRMKDASSTDIVVHRGEALTTFYQCGDVHRLDPRTLETLGTAKQFPAFVSAHPKVDEATGELLFFEYSKVAPYLHFGVIAPDGTLARYTPVPLPGPRLPHDMAFTQRFAIFNDFPLFWDPAKLAQNLHRPRYVPDLGSRFALVPRDGDGPVRWFDAAPTYVLHFTNAYEDGDEVVLEGFHQSDPMPRGDTAIATFMKSLDMNALGTRLHRWRFNLLTGATREERLDDEVAEFPMIDARFAGRRHSTVIAMTGAPGHFLFDGMIRYDVERGGKQRYRFPEGVFASESPVVPRGEREADGYVVTFTSDVRNDNSECQIFDASDIARGPIARVRLPHRISSGTHATWMPAQ
ncbi:MAG: carotenoid oxygenase family protein [Polyangiales bacterium]